MRDIRVQNNMTMAEVGKRINKSENTISRYELGMTQLSLKTLKQLCNIYNVDMQSVFDKMNSQSYEDIYSVDEQHLVNVYRQLSEHDREVVMTLAEGLIK